MADWVSYCGALGAVSWPCHSAHWQCRRLCPALCHAPCRRPLVTKQKLFHDSIPCNMHCAPCRTHCHACRSAPASYRKKLLCCIAALLRRIATPKVAPFSRYKNCIVTQNPCRVRAGPCRGPIRPCRGAVSQGCWSYRGPLLRAPTRLCHDTTYCIVTQLEKWVVSHPVSLAQFFFFFFHFHFSLFHLLED